MAIIVSMTKIITGGARLLTPLLLNTSYFPRQSAGHPNNRIASIIRKQAYCYRNVSKPGSGPTRDQQQQQLNMDQIKRDSEEMSRQQVLRTYLQIIPPHRLQALIQPEKTDLSQFIEKAQTTGLDQEQLQKLYKKLKKAAHMINVEELTKLLEATKSEESTSEECRALSRKICTKIINVTRKKLNVLNLEQIVNFMFSLVKLNHKDFEFMKEVQRVIIEQKIKISYPLIRKILFSFTHLDVGSSVLYSHICKTLRVGQYEFAPLELAEAAYMLSKSSQNASGGYGVFLLAEKHLLTHFPRLQFHDLVKAASFMLTQNLGTNDFQMEFERQLYNKYPDKVHLRANDLVSLLKATSAYYFKFNDKALLNKLQASTHRMASNVSLEQFQDIVWSWGRAGKGDTQLWRVLEEQIMRKHLNMLRLRQVAFFYYSLCSTEYASAGTINALEEKFLSMVESTENVNEHYLIKFLLGMQKRKDYSEESFVKISSMITQRFDKLSMRQLITFAKIINESDLCYENKQKFKDMEDALMKACQKSIPQKIYMFRPYEVIEILYMWIKLDVAGQSQSELTKKFLEVLFGQIEGCINDIPKSAFIKALFCFCIKDKYGESVQMVAILENLLQYGQVGYFFSPYELPLAAYCVYHLIVNSNGKITFRDELVDQLGRAVQQINPVILNRFVKSGYDQCLKLKHKYEKGADRFRSKPRSKKY